MNNDKKETRLLRRRFGSSSRNETIMQPVKQINNKLLLPILNYDRKASAMVFKEETNILLPEENFEIDDDTNIRLK